jgi:N-methylhydantoinase B
MLDGDGTETGSVAIRAAVTLCDGEMIVDFSGTDPAVAGSLNAVPAIVESAVMYVVRCIAGESLPMNQGVFAPVQVRVPRNSVLNPEPPHAVAGGNVETSMRIVDVLYGALARALPDRIPAASQGTMNNVTFGGTDPHSGKPFAYYETMGGGSGAGPQSDGASGIHCHMSNTLNTPVEALETALPVRLRCYALRRGSGGEGRSRGGDGLVREIEFLARAQVTVLSERRDRGPYGIAGGRSGTPGKNTLLPKGEGAGPDLGGKATFVAEPGDVLRIETPGGGGWGAPENGANT